MTKRRHALPPRHARRRSISRRACIADRRDPLTPLARVTIRAVAGVVRPRPLHAHDEDHMPMPGLDSAFVQCPYCGEEIEVLVDGSVDQQTYVEDCSVCCRPIVFTVAAEDGEVISVEARGEDE
jgi:Cysteine-rich CPXCG